MSLSYNPTENGSMNTMTFQLLASRTLKELFILFEAIQLVILSHGKMVQQLKVLAVLVEFGSQHPHGSSQTSTTLVIKDVYLLLTSIGIRTHGVHIHLCKQSTHKHKITKQRNLKEQM